MTTTTANPIHELHELLKAQKTLLASLGKNVKFLRRQRRMTQAVLAAAMRERGVPLHASTINRVEEGKRRVSLDELSKFAEVLGVSTSEFIGDAEERHREALLRWLLAESQYRLEANP